MEQSESIGLDVSIGGVKAYHKEKLQDMENELKDKEERKIQLSTHISYPNINDGLLNRIRQDFHLVINL